MIDAARNVGIAAAVNLVFWGAAAPRFGVSPTAARWAAGSSMLLAAVNRVPPVLAPLARIMNAPGSAVVQILTNRERLTNGT